MKRPRSKGFGKELTHTELIGLLSYNEETGIFRWREYRRGARIEGLAGTKSTANGYWQITIRDRLYFAHRLAWLYVHGEWPAQVIDHIDGNKLNNRISNLRDVSHKENMNGFRSRSYRWTWRDCPDHHF